MTAAVMVAGEGQGSAERKAESVMFRGPPFRGSQAEGTDEGTAEHGQHRGTGSGARASGRQATVQRRLA